MELSIEELKEAFLLLKKDFDDLVLSALLLKARLNLIERELKNKKDKK